VRYLHSSIKLPGKQLINELSITKEEVYRNVEFTDIGRIKINRKKHEEGIKGLKILHNIWGIDRYCWGIRTKWNGSSFDIRSRWRRTY
jgi:hypothetical protein